MRTAKSVLQRNLQVGHFAPVVITAEMGKGAIRRAQDELHLSRISLAGADATPEQLIALAEIPAPIEPTEDERAAEYAAFTDGAVNDDERTIEYEDYREGLVDRYLRPDFVDWARDRE